MTADQFIAQVHNRLRAIDHESSLQLERSRARVADFEQIHGMSTAELRARLEVGTIQETHDHVVWLIEAQVVERLVESDPT
jgi:hypothetical protein